ncbi:hypothetical protein U879_07305 [Defluviimonas sp. 20V17]|nr:hypothetical protein U879_07305 [Defluviimonas sp. 20V17]
MLIGGETAEMFVAFQSSRVLITRAVQNETNDVFVHEAVGAPCIPVDLPLAPGPADPSPSGSDRWRDLADSAFEQAGERPLHPPSIGIGEIYRRNQRLGYFHDRGSSGDQLRPPC